MSDTFERFQAIAVEVLAVDADKVTKEASFADDLDADSLDLVELVMALEDEFDITRRGGGARGHHDGRPGLRHGRSQALSSA